MSNFLFRQSITNRDFVNSYSFILEMYNAIVKTYVSKFNEDMKYHTAARQEYLNRINNRSKRCEKYTAIVNEWFFKGSAACKSMKDQVVIFCTYMWMLIKAKKQGACPYFRFEDTSKSQESQSTDKNT